MVTIVKKGHINEIVCDKCASTLDFRLDDIRYCHQTYPGPVVEERYFYIECPLCGKELHTEDVMSKELLKQSREKFSN